MAGGEKDKKTQNFEEKRSQGMMIPRQLILEGVIEDGKKELDRNYKAFEKVQSSYTKDGKPLPESEAKLYQKEEARIINSLAEPRLELSGLLEKNIASLQDDFKKEKDPKKKQELIEAKKNLITIQADYIKDLAHNVTGLAENVKNLTEKIEQLKKNKDKLANLPKAEQSLLNTKKEFFEKKDILVQTKERLIKTQANYVKDLEEDPNKKQELLEAKKELFELKKDLIPTKSAYIRDLKNEKNKTPEQKEKLAELEESLYKDKKDLAKDLKNTKKEINNQYAQSKNKNHVEQENGETFKNSQMESWKSDTRLTKTSISDDLKHVYKKAKNLIKKIESSTPSKEDKAQGSSRSQRQSQRKSSVLQ